MEKLKQAAVKVLQDEYVRYCTMIVAIQLIFEQ